MKTGCRRDHRQFGPPRDDHARAGTRPDKRRAIAIARLRLISAATLLEAAIVADARSGDTGAEDLDLLVKKLRLQVVPFTAEHFALARDAFRRFGKGRHPARLNFGDCISYAVAKQSRHPLLFKGDDFSKTDIPAVSY